MAKKIIGTMSGTSLDGIDVAMLITDGEGLLEPGATAMRPYTKAEQKVLRGAMEAVQGGEGTDSEAVREAEKLVTEAHIEAIKTLMSEEELSPQDISMVGFHGQTLFHAPHQQTTIQIGDASALAGALDTTVCHDFRSDDVATGGEGAPLVPVFHHAILSKTDVSQPAAILNIGGVANITVVEGSDFLAFDTGPGNALIDDWMKSRTARSFDQWGRIAGEGTVKQDIVDEWLSHDYFERDAPKSLDRNAFDVMAIDRASLADGAATLTAFSAQSIALALRKYNVKTLYVAGGGANNRTMMRMVGEACGLEPRFMDDLGFDGDFLEAYAFAYLSARVEAGLPITYPSTTGVKRPLTGGKVLKV